MTHTIPFPVPDSLPIDICTHTPSGTELCIQTGSVVDNFGGRQDCQNGTTPPLITVPVNITEKDDFGYGEIKVEISPWIGVETDLDAVWVGESTSQQCARFSLPKIEPAPSPDVSPSIDKVIDILFDVAKDIVDFLGFNPHRGSGKVLVYLVVIVLFLLLARRGFYVA